MINQEEIARLDNKAEKNQRLMAKIIVRNKSEKGDVCSVKVLIGGSYADDNAARYFRVPVNKLVMPAESND